jgi:hypothetical protein
MQRLMGASAPGETMKLGGSSDVRGQQQEGESRGERSPSYQDGRRACSSKSAASAATRVQSSRVGTWSAGAIGLRRREGSAGKAHSRGCGLRVAGCGQNKRKA